MGLIKIHKFIFNGFSFSDFASTLLTLSQNMKLLSAVVVRRNMLAPSSCLTTGLSDREMAFMSWKIHESHINPFT